MKKISILLLLLLLWLTPMGARAAENGCDVTIPVTIRVKGEHVPAGKDYQVSLEAITPEAPVPTETTIKRTGAGALSFGPIHYTRPGDYEYRVTQTTADGGRFTYDRTVYTVTVRITRAEDGAWQSEIWARKGESTEKTDQIQFENRYKAPSPPSDSGGDTTESRTLRAVQTSDPSWPLFWQACAGLACSGMLIAFQKSRKKGRA